jgi:hypothetical protein
VEIVSENVECGNIRWKFIAEIAYENNTWLYGNRMDVEIVCGNSIWK